MHADILTPMIARAMRIDLEVNALAIEQRREWEEIKVVQRLERALSVARQRLGTAVHGLPQTR
ncbi:MAG: hypothetical protein M0R74_04430 [Dehalococcoidia bacterium]|nr:hypothetical protein [Dehalococcoidia bacterium]